MATHRDVLQRSYTTRWDVIQMLDEIAREVGFTHYQSLADHEPERDGAPSLSEIARCIETSAALDPTRGTRTTPHDMVALLP